jgi:hypothetical protein
MDVREILDQREREKPRYAGLGFSASSAQVLVDIKDKLVRYLSPIDVWSFPGRDLAPNRPISRLELCEKAFSDRHPNGLIVYLPEEWMFDWPDKERMAFWAALAQTFGINSVYVVFSGAPFNTQLISHYFLQTAVPGQQFSLWTSRYGL